MGLGLNARWDYDMEGLNTNVMAMLWVVEWMRITVGLAMVFKERWHMTADTCKNES
jgi:hypothetical protein